MGTSVHHDHAVARAEQELRLPDYAHTIIGNAVEEQNPITDRVCPPNLPTGQGHSVGRRYGEILAMRVYVRKQRMALLN